MDQSNPIYEMSNHVVMEELMCVAVLPPHDVCYSFGGILRVYFGFDELDQQKMIQKAEALGYLSDKRNEKLPLGYLFLLPANDDGSFTCTAAVSQVQLEKILKRAVLDAFISESRCLKMLVKIRAFFFMNGAKLLGPRHFFINNVLQDAEPPKKRHRLCSDFIQTREKMKTVAEFVANLENGKAVLEQMQKAEHERSAYLDSIVAAAAPISFGLPISFEDDEFDGDESSSDKTGQRYEQLLLLAEKKKIAESKKGISVQSAQSVPSSSLAPVFPLVQAPPPVLEGSESDESSESEDEEDDEDEDDETEDDVQHLTKDELIARVANLEKELSVLPSRPSTLSDCDVIPAPAGKEWYMDSKLFEPKLRDETDCSKFWWREGAACYYVVSKNIRCNKCRFSPWNTQKKECVCFKLRHGEKSQNLWFVNNSALK